MRNALLIFVLFVCLPLSAQTPYLVKDINTTRSNNTTSSSPSEFAAFGTKVFFAATSAAAGTELWSTDGTSGGTSMVSDIIPGTGSSSPSSLTAVNGVLLFTARDVNHGFELWTTDGTAAGTRILLDINPGPTSGLIAGPSSPLQGFHIVFHNRMLFMADDGTNGRELWTTDGTTAGTRLLKDINPGAASSTPAYLTILNDAVYFAATGGLWKTDGTEAGTVKVAAVSARNLTAAGSQLFFEGFTAAAGWEPWVSDGTESGTHMIADVLPGTKGSLDTQYYFLGFDALGKRVVFPADDGVHGRELWVSDGTAAGTRMIRDMTPGPTGTWDSSYAYLTTLGDRAYFRGTDADHGWELWVTDGTDAGTTLFADLTPGPTPSYPFVLVASGGKLFMAAETTASGPQLWVTDGTSAGTHSLGGSAGLGLGYNSVYLSAVNGKLYFGGTTPLNGNEPWVSDGTDAGTRMIANLARDETPSANPSPLGAAGNLLFFVADEGTSTSGLGTTAIWRTDGTAAGTFKVRETAFSDPFQAVGPYLFFREQVNNPKLAMSDGTLAGTKSADDFLRRFGTSQLGAFFPFGDSIFATMYDLDFNDTTLWKTTAPADAPAFQLGGRNPFGLIEVAGNYFFYSQTTTTPYAFGLWRTDGTRAGTYGVVPALNNDYGSLSKLVNAEGTVFFLKLVRDENVKLWKSDGTLDGTVVVKELPFSQGQFQSQLKTAGRRLFFVISNALWTSDGTESGTIELAKVKFFPSFDNDDLRVVGNHVVYTNYDNDTGSFELWTSDGTVAGTKLLRPLGNGFAGLTTIDGLIYLNAPDDEHGSELWTTDGTAEGTKLLLDMNPGPASSSPGGFTKVGDLLYFSAYTEGVGRELWALPLTDTRLSIADARAVEGDSGTTVMRFNVSLTPAAEQPVTVDYATSDGTAKAGEDYDAASGTLTFAPGETAKTIDVRVHGDTAPENNELFYVALRNVSGARVIRPEAGGIIDDDDQSADLGIAIAFGHDTFQMNDSIRVSNAGPRGATDVVVQTTATPSIGGSTCFTCAIPQLAVGATVAAVDGYYAPSQQQYLSATVSARQADRVLSNNTTAWTVNGDRTIAMNAAYLTPGATATISARTFTLAPVITSSDPSVLSAPSTMTPGSDGYGTFSVTALKAGTSTITVDNRKPLLVTVVPSGTAPRWPGGMTLVYDFTGTGFDHPITITAIPSGTAPGTGARPTGTVIVTSAGHELARGTINGNNPVVLPIYLSSLGSIPYVVAYSGDANFLPQTLDATIFVYQGAVTMTGGLEAVTGAAGTFAMTVKTTGSPVAAPTGMLSILNGTTEIARVPLVPTGGGVSMARATLTNLPSSPTLTVKYLGDTFYNQGTQQIRAINTRHHSAGH
jgi:ELWxxDGT repeat protein